MIAIGALARPAAAGPVAAKPTLDAAPAELFASVAIGPVTTFRNLQAFANTISPGSADALTDRLLRRELAQAIGASSLDGLDPTGWMYLLVADGTDAPALALVGKVSDARALTASAGANYVAIKHGWAAIGARPLIDRIGPYALATIATQPTPRAPGATVYVSQLVARYHTEIAAFRDKVAAAIPTAPGSDARFAQIGLSMFHGAYEALEDTDRIAVTVEATPAIASIDLALTPKPGSRFGAFVAVQRPSAYALIDKLPAAASSVMIAGHLDAGPYRAGLLDLFDAMWGSGAGPELSAALTSVLDTATGEVVIALQSTADSGLAITELFGVTAVAAADQAIARVLDLFKTGRTFGTPPMMTTMTTDPKTTTYDGIVLRGYSTTYDLSGAAPAQRQAMELIMKKMGQNARIATFDQVGLAVVAADSATVAHRAIDAARGKAAHFTADTQLAPQLAASRARHDSLALVFDFSALFAALLHGNPAAVAASPIVSTLGFADHRAHLGLALPAAAVRALKDLGKP